MCKCVDASISHTICNSIKVFYFFTQLFVWHKILADGPKLTSKCKLSVQRMQTLDPLHVVDIWHLLKIFSDRVVLAQLLVTTHQDDVFATMWSILTQTSSSQSLRVNHMSVNGLQTQFLNLRFKGARHDPQHHPPKFFSTHSDFGTKSLVIFLWL